MSPLPLQPLGRIQFLFQNEFVKGNCLLVHQVAPKKWLFSGATLWMCSSPSWLILTRGMNRVWPSSLVPFGFLVCVFVCEHTPTLVYECACASVLNSPRHTSSSPQSFANFTDSTPNNKPNPPHLSPGSTLGSIVCDVTPVRSPWWTLMRPDIGTGLRQAGY